MTQSQSLFPHSIQPMTLNDGVTYIICKVSVHLDTAQVT